MKIETNSLSRILYNYSSRVLLGVFCLPRFSFPTNNPSALFCLAKQLGLYSSLTLIADPFGYLFNTINRRFNVCSIVSLWTIYKVR